MPFEDMEDVALTLDEATEYLGNYCPAHNVDEAGMVALLEAYFMVQKATDAVWKLESLLTHKSLEEILGRPDEKR